MSRPLRILYPNAWYHIMNRGASRLKIFHDNNDYQTFLKLFAEIHRRYRFEIHAYCLMPNHYHVLLRTPLANLSNGMRHLDGLYTIYHNRKYKKDGALFRGRYKSVLVDAENYLLSLSRYIHLNPVKAGLAEHPINYRWSSYRHYRKNIAPPNWLYINEILDRFGIAQRKNKYSLFVMEKTDHELENFFRKTKLLPILGSDAFRKNISETYLQNKTQFKNIPDHKSVCKKPELPLILETVATYYGTSIETLHQVNHLNGNQPRTVAIYLAAEISGQKFKAIADFFKNISDAGVSQIIRRVNKLILKKPDLVNDISNLNKLIIG